MFLDDIVGPMSVKEAKAIKQRLDAKCWKGKHKEGTKIKGGVRVNNCVPNESVAEDSWHGQTDAWHAGDNAWSSENHEMVEGHSFSNGDQVELKPEYADRAGEVYTVSQCDSERGRCWIGDADGRGWYARFDQLIPSVGQDELDEFAPSPERDDDDEVPDQILTLANRWWNATDDQPKITNVLRSLGWSISQVESEDDAVQMQHDDGTTYFISADDFDPDVFEGWSDAVVAQRTGRPRTPYSVYIKGKKWKDFENDDHAEAVANKLRAKFRADGRDPSVITIAPTDYDKGMAEAISKKDLLSKLAKDLNTPFKKAKSGELKSNGSDFTKGDHWTGPDKDDPSYTRNFGHGYPDTPSNRSHDRYVNKSLKNDDLDEAEGRVDPILIKALKRMPDGLATHHEVLDAAYDAYAMELGYLSMKGNYGVTDVYIPKLMGLYKDKHGLTFNEAGSPAQQAAIAIAKKKEQGVEEAIVASGPSKPLDDRAVRKLVWDTMKINADSGEQAIQRALSVLAKKPQSRMVQDLQDKFQNLADRLSQGLAEMDKSQKGAPGWNIDDYDYSKGKWTQGKIMTAKDATAYARTELDKHFNDPEQLKKAVNKVNKKGVEESTNYWTKLQDQRNTKLNSLVDELKESVKK